MCNKLVTNINNIDTSWFVSKNQYDTDESGLETKIDDKCKEIIDTTDLVQKHITKNSLLRQKVK